MIRVLVDSSSDYSLNEAKEKGIEMIPINIVVDGIEYKDEIELSRSKLFETMLDGDHIIKTSQPSPSEYLDIFEDVKAKGDQMIVITLSSALSGTYQSACLAKDMAEYDDIYVIDSLTATTAIRIIADYAKTLVDSGMPVKEIVEKVEHIKKKVKIRAALDTLHYLYLGGRVKRVTALAAKAAHIKVAITVSEQGKADIIGKYLGVARAIKDMVKHILETKLNKNLPLYVMYCHNSDNALKLKAAFEKVGIIVADVLQLGATLGSHIGPGGFGYMYAEE